MVAILGLLLIPIYAFLAIRDVKSKSGFLEVRRLSFVRVVELYSSAIKWTLVSRKANDGDSSYKIKGKNRV